MTGTRQNCTVSFSRWPMMQVSKLSAVFVSFSSFRSRPAQKLSPAPYMTTPWTSRGIVEKVLQTKHEFVAERIALLRVGSA